MQYNKLTKLSGKWFTVSVPKESGVYRQQSPLLGPNCASATSWFLSWIWFFSNEIINSQKKNALKLDTISYFQPLLSETNTAARVRSYRICKPSESQNKLNTVRKQCISFVLWEKKIICLANDSNCRALYLLRFGVTVFAVILHWV